MPTSSFHFPSNHHDQVWGYQTPHSNAAAEHRGISKEDARRTLDYLAEHNLSHPRKADQVQPGLYLGDLLSAKDFSDLDMKHITHVLSVCKCPDLKYPDFLKITHKVVAVDDSTEADLLDQFQDCWRFITNALDAGGRVLVHCEQGISRSATVMAAFLMKTERLHSMDAIRYIKKFRPIVDPNEGFREQLHIWGQCRGVLTNKIEYLSWKKKHGTMPPCAA